MSAGNLLIEAGLAIIETIRDAVSKAKLKEMVIFLRSEISRLNKMVASLIDACRDKDTTIADKNRQIKELLEDKKNNYQRSGK